MYKPVKFREDPEPSTVESELNERGRRAEQRRDREAEEQLRLRSQPDSRPGVWRKFLRISFRYWPGSGVLEQSGYGAVHKFSNVFVKFLPGK